MNPDASTVAAGAPGGNRSRPDRRRQIVKVFWRSQPIFISHRTQKEVDEARAVDTNSLRDPHGRRRASSRPRHTNNVGDLHPSGLHSRLPIKATTTRWFCPCHGSQYDSSGRDPDGSALESGLSRYQSFRSKIHIGETEDSTPKGCTMSGKFDYQPQSGFMQWLERRLPIGGRSILLIVYPNAAATELMVTSAWASSPHSLALQMHRRGGWRMHYIHGLAVPIRSKPSCASELLLGSRTS